MYKIHDATFKIQLYFNFNKSSVHRRFVEIEIYLNFRCLVVDLIIFDIFKEKDI